MYNCQIAINTLWYTWNILPQSKTTIFVLKKICFQEPVQEALLVPADTPEKAPLKLDASTLGDLPAQYTICSLEPHQFPVVGVYIDRRVTPGFKYRVRPLPEVGKPSTINKCLFDERALTLKSIGRGYARRFTFEADKPKLDNDNYFWSDNRPEGYAFELELISEGDKFTFFDHNEEPQGTVEILKIKVSIFDNGLFKIKISKRYSVGISYIL